MTLNSQILRGTFVAALGGLLFGFDTAVIAGTTAGLTAQYRLTPASLGVTVAAALWGTILGAMLASIPGDRFGRRDSLRGMAVLYLISALGCAFAWNWSALILFRLLGGLGIGGSSVLGPMYIAEIAPARWRGRMVGFFQFNVVFGILLAYFSNYRIGLLDLNAWEWRAKLGVAAIPAALFLVMLGGIVRSPRWLAGKHRLEEAREALRRIGDDPDAELREITGAIAAEHAERGDRLFSRKYRLPVFLAISIGMFNQLSGINAILYYLNDIFARAGFGKVSGDLQAVAVGLTNLAFTMLGMAAIDRLGRRPLLLIGSVGTAGALSGVAAIFFAGRGNQYLVWLLAMYIAFFGLSQGAVIWVYISEVFPQTVRARGQSLGSFSHWFMNALISGLFPVFAAASGAYPFVFFALMMVVQFFVVFFIYPETKGVSLEHMRERMGIAD